MGERTSVTFLKASNLGSILFLYTSYINMHICTHTDRAYLSDFFDGIKLGFYPLFERAALQILIAGFGRV